MVLQAVISYLHYLSFIALFSLLVVEHLWAKPKLKVEVARRLARIDLFYALALLLVFVTGLLRTVWFGNGLGYYLANGMFHLKTTLFFVVVLLAIYPAIIFRRLRRRAAHLPVDEHLPLPRAIPMILRAELLLMALIPLFATFTSRGIGQFG